jgi:hypothetical protein
VVDRSPAELRADIEGDDPRRLEDVRRRQSRNATISVDAWR